jgi:Cellulase (glycosyl hydrolase family 5)
MALFFFAGEIRCSEESGSQKDPRTHRAGFLYRDGNKLMLDGKAYVSASFNSFQLSGCGHPGEVFTDEQMESLLASLPDNILVRTWAFPGHGAQIDKVIKAAEKHGIKLILTLGDGRSHCGHADGAPKGDGSGKVPEWYATGFRKEYLPHVRKMTAAYKDSPAIGMWEILNEPGDAKWPVIRKFFDEVADVIKDHDPNHLVGSGSWAPWAYGGPENFQTLHSGPDIDVGSLHEYDYDYKESNTIESPHFAGALKAMNNLGKVLIIGETGIKSGDSCRTDRATRMEAIRKKFDVYLGKGAGAVLIWNLAQSTSGCSFTFAVDDPLVEMIRKHPVNNP